MKRNGFVSNSSSCSFVIRKVALTRLQLIAIRHHGVVGRWLGIDYPDYAWMIDETISEIRGYTSMDNFDMREFLEAIGVVLEDVEMEWSE